MRELAHAQILARELGAENALLFVSIDNLKDIIDCHGHAVGDAMVEHSADVMLHHFRKANVVGRLGGGRNLQLSWLTQVKRRRPKRRCGRGNC